jgi:macrolide-specific efflux system membrane fusion protein
MNRATKKFLYLAMIAVPTVIVFYFWVFAGNSSGPDPSTYTYVTVQKQDLSQSVTATGIIKAQVGAEVKVGAQVSGIVKDLYVEVGSKVQKNQLLAVIDPEVYQAKLDEALAQKQNARIEKKYAEIDLERLKPLYGTQAIAKQQFDTASQLVEATEAKLKKAEADLEYAKLQLNYTRIISPIDGVVTSVTTQRGETVAASFVAPTFVTIIDLKKLELWAYVDETDIGKIENKQPVTFYVDTYPGRSIAGTVKTIFPNAEIQNNVVNYVVVVTIKNEEGIILRPQMSATVNIYTQYKKDVLAVPKRAVRFDESGRKYVSVSVNGTIQKRFITTGISDEKNYEVLAGLSTGDRIISDVKSGENNDSN